jgi:hypothetical protein
MDKDEIIKMAKQAGFSSAVGKHIALDEDLVAFAKLVAQHEREACMELTDSRCQCGWLIQSRGQA